MAQIRLSPDDEVESTRRPTPEDRQSLEDLVEEYYDQLSHFEQELLESLDGQKYWTSKQCDIFDELVTRKLRQ